MQRDALAKVDGSVVECFPVEAELEVVCAVHVVVCARCNGPQGGFEFAVVHPDLDVFAVEELIESARVIHVEVADYTGDGLVRYGLSATSSRKSGPTSF